MLDEMQNKVEREKGVDPSYSDIIDEMLEGTEVKEKKKEKRDFMELF